MEHSKAQFNAIRKRVGLSQEDIANALGNAVRTVKRWESPNYQQPPADAWEYLENALKQHIEAVNKSVEMVKQIGEKVGSLPDHVDFLYYKTQRQYDLYGRDPGSYMIVNARTREIAVRLEQLGVEARFHYPEEDERLFTQLANTRGGLEEDE